MEVIVKASCKQENETQQAMATLHPSLPSLHDSSSTTNEPPIKRVKLESSSSIHDDNDATKYDGNGIVIVKTGLKADKVDSSEDPTINIGNRAANNRGGKAPPDVSLVATVSSTKDNFAGSVSPMSVSASNSSNSSIGPTTQAAEALKDEDRAASTESVNVASDLRNISQAANTKKIAPLVKNMDPDTSSASCNSPSNAIVLPVKVKEAVIQHNAVNEPQIGPDREDMVDDDTLPLKSTTFHHLRHKYIDELDYMLVEFQKLERQLLGAKTQSTTESDGSRERREKLHSFILHLEETVQQIASGCQLESEGKSSMISSSAVVSSSLSTSANIRKVDTENVQKLEDHILANLLPVKVRLKRQLAAQQGAKHNPAGMPTVRGGMQPLVVRTQQPKATFLRSDVPTSSAQRQQPTSLIKPMVVEGREGSCITQKLHGQVLGSTVLPLGQKVKSNTHSGESGDTSSHHREITFGRCNVSVHGVEKSKTFYAGLPTGTSHVKISSPTASNTHQHSSQDPNIVDRASEQNRAQLSKSTSIPTPTHNASCTSSTTTTAGNQATSFSYNNERDKGAAHKKASAETNQIEAQVHSAVSSCVPSLLTSQNSEHVVKSTASTDPAKEEQNQDQLNNPNAALIDSCALTPAARNAILCYEERRRLLKKRRKKKKRNGDPSKLEASLGAAQQAELPTSKRSKKSLSQRGPRNVEYMCALCNEVYNSTCDHNPWWALTLHDCPKCEKLQIPRIDISAPANAIEYHPALLAHADENGGVNCHTPCAVMFSPPKPSSSIVGSDSESDLSDDDCLLSDGEDSLYISESDMEDVASMSLADQAENEKFGAEYDGPKLTDIHASKLLILILHAATCPGQHRSENHNDVCRSTKWMMLHVRDCPGTTSCGDICPFPWCRKVKHLLYHLVSCESPCQCAICTPVDISLNMRKLRSLNECRLRKAQEKLSLQEPMVETANSVAGKAENMSININENQLGDAAVDVPKSDIDTSHILLGLEPQVFHASTRTVPDTNLPDEMLVDSAEASANLQDSLVMTGTAAVKATNLDVHDESSAYPLPETIADLYQSARFASETATVEVVNVAEAHSEQLENDRSFGSSFPTPISRHGLSSKTFLAPIADTTTSACLSQLTFSSSTDVTDLVKDSQPIVCAAEESAGIPSLCTPGDHEMSDKIGTSDETEERSGDLIAGMHEIEFDSGNEALTGTSASSNGHPVKFSSDPCLVKSNSNYSPYAQSSSESESVLEANMNSHQYESKSSDVRNDRLSNESLMLLVT